MPLESDKIPVKTSERSGTVVARLEGLVAALSDEVENARSQLRSLEQAKHLVPLTELPARVREAREREGLSLSQLADLVGLSKTTLQQLEQGRANPRLDTLRRVTEALGLRLWVE